MTAPVLETVFDFDGVRLLVFPVHSDTASISGEPAHTQRSLWRPQGDIVSVSPDPGEAWTVKPSKARAAKEGTFDGPDTDPVGVERQIRNTAIGDGGGSLESCASEFNSEISRQVNGVVWTRVRTARDVARGAAGSRRHPQTAGAEPVLIPRGRAGR